MNMSELTWSQNLLFGVLFFTAVAVGWILGRRSLRSATTLTQLPRDYFVGLNYLINEQPDHATDVFVKMLEVNSDSVEAHLALGNLFRRKGEVERAIRLHQNLIARPNLLHSQRNEALLALAQDYMSAGLLDRAEGLFLDLAESSDKKLDSLRALVDIYEQEKDWQKAIEVSSQLSKILRVSYSKNIAHYYCELATLALSAQDESLSRDYCKKAESYDAASVRASIFLGRLAFRQGLYHEAILAYRRVKNQNHAFLPEILEDMRICYEKLGNSDEFSKFLKECLSEFPSMSLIWAFAKLMRKIEGPKEAQKFILSQLKQRLSLKGISHYLELQSDGLEQNNPEEMIMLRNFIKTLSREKPVYQCKDCGFSGKKLYWQCPGCKRWERVEPIQGLEGD